MFLDIFICAAYVELLCLGYILEAELGKSFFMALVEPAAHLAVVKTNEKFKSARQEDLVLCLQDKSEQDPIGGGRPHGQREL